MRSTFQDLWVLEFRSGLGFRVYYSREGPVLVILILPHPAVGS